MARLINDVDELEAIPEGGVVWQEFRKPRHYKWIIDRKYGLTVLDNAEYIPDNLLVTKLPTMFDKPRVSPLVMYRGILGNEIEYLLPSEMDAADYIRMQIRIWDVKPTEQEMAETPWPTKEECEAYW